MFHLEMGSFVSVLFFHKDVTYWLDYFLQEKTGGFAGIFKKSPKPSPRSAVTQVIKSLNTLKTYKESE